MHRSASNKRKVNLIDKEVDVVDSSYRSAYFVVSELESTLTAGKNYFTINGSSLLKKNSPISLEILDSSGRTVYYEMGKVGYLPLTDVTDLIISVHVFDDTAGGMGSITLLGMTVDNKSVKWTSNIKINPIADNESRVIFMKIPSMEASEFLSFVLNETWTSEVQQTTTTSASIYSIASFPPVYSDIKSVNLKKFDVDYRLILNPNGIPSPAPFVNQNKDDVMVLHIQNISYLDNGVIRTATVNLTESVSIKSIINDHEISLVSPIIYEINGIRQVVPIVDGEFVQTFNGTAYITSSGLIPYGTSDGVPDPNVFLSKPVGATTAFVKEPFLDVTYKNLKTLTGKIHRHKVYRRSLNKASDFECVADEPLLETEVIFDTSTANRTFAAIGEFFNQDHTERYYHTSSVNMLLSQSSSDILNSAVLIPGSDNEDGSEYVIIKNDTSLITYSSSREVYVNYDESQFLIKSGSSYDSNFIQLYNGSDYLMSADLDIKKLNPSREAKLVFYLTGSYNTSSTVPNFEEGRGIKLHEYVLPIGKMSKKFSGNHDGKILNFTQDCRGTIKIVPINIDLVRMSNISLKSFAEFGFSPDSFSTRIFFPVSIKNEQFEIKSEFFDVNSRSIYSELRGVINIDKYGETLFKNITNYLVTDSETIRSVISSGSLTISSSRLEGGSGFDSDLNRAALSLVESFVVMKESAFDNDPFFAAEHQVTSNKTYVKVSGSFKLTGSLYIKGVDERLYGTSSHAISSSYALVASSSLSASGAASSLSSSRSISSSYAYVASSSLSASGAASSLSSSWSISSSYAYVASSSLSSSGAASSLSSSWSISSSYAYVASSSLSSSWSISSSYAYVASSSLSSSGANTALSSSRSISSSYAYVASSSLSSSGANSSLSSSWSISASNASSSMSSSHILYGESANPMTPIAAGYITATLAGARIYIPYYTSV